MIKPHLKDLPVEVLFVKTHQDAVLPKRNHGNRPITEEEMAALVEERKQIAEMRASLGEPYKEIPISVKDWMGTCDSGYDVFACEDAIIPHEGNAIVPVGIKVGYITPGYWVKVESRSGLSFKSGILAHPGIIDNQYRGDMGVCLYNHSGKAYCVKKGDKIAQLVVYQLWDFNVGWVEEAEKTERGEKGFGSSDKPRK
jgi:dUTP pyrophosphatase